MAATVKLKSEPLYLLYDSRLERNSFIGEKNHTTGAAFLAAERVRGVIEQLILGSNFVSSLQISAKKHGPPEATCPKVTFWPNAASPLLDWVNGLYWIIGDSWLEVHEPSRELLD